MIVAYYMPHNDGVESGVLTEPGQSTGSTLVDLYEVDGEIRSFETEDEARAWLIAIAAENAPVDDCEFTQENPHEWYCTVHDVLVVAGTTEPVSCPAAQ